jgi:hypothetical protein
MKAQKFHNGAAEVLDVFPLGVFTPLRSGRLLLGICFSRAFAGKLCATLRDRCCGSPDATREELPPDFLLNQPVITGSFYAASQGGVTGR